MSLLVWVMMAIALWHFTIWLPDRFWGGIVGALLAAVIGSVVLAFIGPVAPAYASGPAAEFSRASHSDVSPPLRSIRPHGPQPGKAFPALRRNSAFGEIALAPPDRRRQAYVTPGAPVSTGAAWEGIGNVNAVIPPDTNGDVGPNDY